MKKMICVMCEGDGFTAEHDPNDPHEEGCSNCPIQVQCDYCMATGMILISDVKILLEKYWLIQTGVPNVQKSEEEVFF